jgi:hypothetical protein
VLPCPLERVLLHPSRETPPLARRKRQAREEESRGKPRKPRRRRGRRG